MTPKVNDQQQTSFKVSLYAPGISGLTTTALLKVMEDLMKIANLYGIQFTKQIQMQSDIATSLGDYQEALGESEMADYIGQAFANGLGGLISLGTSTIGSSSEELTTTQKELNDAQAEQEKLKNMESPATGVSEQEIEETENSSELLSQSERGQQIEENNEKITTLSKKLETLKDELQAKMQKQSSIGQSLQNLVTSGSNVNTALQKEKQGEENSNITLSQATMQGMEQISSESLQNSNKYLQQSESITEILKAISSSNRFINS